MWQHIMEDHDYDYLIFVGIHYDSLKIYIISKYHFMKLKTKGLVTQQGRAEGQGLWITRKKILPYLTEIKDINHFYNIIIPKKDYDVIDLTNDSDGDVNMN